ncbi:MAG: DUF6504 family protein [Chloroflexi bacterium]|jgi:hypothetical protein|nr:DUF6504 family protein [Chloroflexota bacterium]
MSRIWSAGEPIDVHTDDADAPIAFTWNGRAHRVDRIDEEWRVDADWWSEAGEVSRRHVRLITHSGYLCVICQDLHTQAWTLLRIHD